MKKKMLLIIFMFMFITNANALSFDVNVTNIEDVGTGSLGTIKKIDIPKKELDVLFEDIGAEVNFDLTITNTGDRAGTLKEINVTSDNDKLEYTSNLPEGGLSINGNDTNKVTITAKLKEGAVNGTSSSEIKIKYNYDEGSCPDGEILSEDESMCLCPEGLERNEKGVCVKPEKEVIHCEKDEIYNETKKICEKKVVPVVPENPKTLDNIVLITLLFLVSGLGIYAVMYKRLKTTKKRVTAGVITGVITLALSFTVLASVFGIDNLLGAIVNPITKSKEIIVKVNEEVDLIETWDGECSLQVSELTPENIFNGGSGTEADPYQVKTAEQLSCFAKSVNNGTTYQNEYIKQTKDIKLNDNLNGQVASGDLTSANLWTSAGARYYDSNAGETITRTFAGTYDGDNKIISGLYLTNDSSQGNKGLFGHATNATFKNMKLSDVYMNTSGYTGSLLGYGYENIILDNITTYGTGVYSGWDGSGIISNYDGNNIGSLVIENTTNNINISCAGSCGGIVHRVNGLPESTSYNLILRNVINNGNISETASLSGTGGIIGYTYSSYAKVLAENVINNGNFTFDYDTSSDRYGQNGGGLGGSFGYLSINEVTVKNSSNTGNVTGFNSVGEIGGIIGNLASFNKLTVEDCYNSGKVIASIVVDNRSSLTGAAGIIGSAYGRDATISIKNCYNTGDINSPNSIYAAGILGNFSSNYDSNRLIENCYNTGDITGYHSPGGITGWFGGQITKCYNTGNIVDTTGDSGGPGGLVGYGYAHIDSSYNTGDIAVLEGRPLAGGLCASSCDITNSYNTGNITGVNVGNNSDFGGLVGQYGNISNSYNKGDIIVQSRAQIYVGGIDGPGGSRVHNNVYNLGNIKVTNGAYGYFGGIAPYGPVDNSVNAGNITIETGSDPYSSVVSFYIGGISYYGDNSDYSKITNNFNAGTISFDRDLSLDEIDDGYGNIYKHYIYIGEITASKYGTFTSLNNKFNKNQNGKALGCYGIDSSCTLEDSEAFGTYTTESAPDILSIINGLSLI